MADFIYRVYAALKREKNKERSDSSLRHSIFLVQHSIFSLSIVTGSVKPYRVLRQK
jgi:hypothetical protein